MTIEFVDVMNLYAFEFCSYPMKVMHSDFGDNLSVCFSCGINTQASHPKNAKICNVDVPDITIVDDTRKTDWGRGSQTQTKPVSNPNEAQVKPTTSEELPTMCWIADTKIQMPRGGANADQMPTPTMSVCEYTRTLALQVRLLTPIQTLLTQ